MTAKIKAAAWVTPEPAVRICMLDVQPGAVSTVTDGRTVDGYLTLSRTEAERLHAQLGEALDVLRTT